VTVGLDLAGLGGGVFLGPSENRTLGRLQNRRENSSSPPRPEAVGSRPCSNFAEPSDGRQPACPPPTPPESFVMATSSSKSATRGSHALHRLSLPWVEVSSCLYPPVAPSSSSWNLSWATSPSRSSKYPAAFFCHLFLFRLPFTLSLPALPHSDSTSLITEESVRFLGTVAIATSRTSRLRSN
jgi:hypothetical protein